MVHGPCGMLDDKCPCMKDGTCSKRFPKSFNSETMVDEMGFPVYRRRPSANFVLRKKGTLRLDNQWVVPYNMKLLKKFEAHINVEWCNKTNLLKYLFKYLTKGPDVARFRIRSENENRSVYAVHNPTGRNEIDEYVKCRLIHWFVNLFCLLYVYSVHLSYLFSFLLFAVGIYLLANHFGECLAMIFMVDNLLSRD